MSLFLWKPAMESLLNSAEANLFDLPMIYLFQDFAALCDRFERLQPLGQTINTFFQRFNALWEQAHDTPMRRIFSDLHRRHGSYWALQKGIIDGILLTISDTQTINGLGLLIAGLIQSKSLTLYHMHIIYDTVNFTAVSICASLINVYGQDREHGFIRFCSLIAFTACYFSYAVVFGVRLNEWSNSIPGHCYNAKFIAYPSNSHPKVDLAYLGVTCFYCLAALLGCVGCHDTISATFATTALPLGNTTFGISGLTNIVRSATTQNEVAEFAPFIVILAMAQYPLHLYMVIALRTANEGRLNGDSENAWGFGQIVALVTAVSTILECIKGISEYRCQVSKLKREADATPRAENEETQDAGE
ncbi:hypothetical protein BKA56DRAFT_597648 [Ilyonectria sp. MPI-CAGE-AT-0026]|nr:hypothetical protein BKA56DRAFT_597648 [Ilyonectria sp. MPI-CAGE-AT-0026]